MGNDVARDAHCDVTMFSGIAVCRYHAITMHKGIHMTICYYVLLCPNIIFLFPQLNCS